MFVGSYSCSSYRRSISFASLARVVADAHALTLASAVRPSVRPSSMHAGAREKRLCMEAPGVTHKLDSRTELRWIRIFQYMPQIANPTAIELNHLETHRP